ncbi:MAG: PAS domain-containing sensor histidine kinase [Candidatus Electrothrix aestuarii]|jgi:PAS domain S-box-containing protein|uniref:histidine kinase n=1 Tax=Candidatus Electrothrix aestuarii TaxID=3062594 RepID=A0AAU8LQC3_9BACT|nr:PAS domain-containing sensor histidine kinase [Candidatus Electrothrix aestuarii]WPD24460.1 MAG: PAS domain-containing sensor histidine kinase [Candidatus Electrothrix sp. GW3-3]
MMSQGQLNSLIIAELPVALFVVDKDYKIVEFNPAAEKITGMTRQQVLGCCCSEVLSSNICEYDCPLKESVTTGQPCLGREAIIRTRSGNKVPIILSGRAITKKTGELLCCIEIFRDATDTKELDAHKRNLISLFTHDLKAPVMITGGFVNRLIDGKAGPLNEKQTSYLKIIQNELRRQEEYIQSFLDASKIESGRIELELQPCELAGLLKDIVTGFKVQASLKQIDIKLEMEHDLGQALLDKLHFGRVISNLLDNAIKYSQKDTLVQMQVRQTGKHFIFEINDQGPGIALQNQPHIFEHYYRPTRHCCEQAKGSGLGLAAVKAIVEAHSGSVWLHSIPGEGSTFFVSLPK